MKKNYILLFALISISTFSQTLNFTSKAGMATARAGSSAATDGVNEYIANGFSTTSGYTSEIEKYSYANNTWSAFATSTATVAKRYGNAEIVNGLLYLFNGTKADGTSNDQLEIIELGSGFLSYGAVNPYPVSSAGSAVHGNDIYFFGGYIGGTQYSKAVYKYNTLTAQWSQLADMDIPTEITGKIVNDKLYTFGGHFEANSHGENFETVATTGSLALTDWINVAETGTKVYEGKTFASNKYAQITAFGTTHEPSNIAWLISPEYYKVSSTPNSDTVLNFDTKDGYNNGATLQAYIITNWTGDITTSAKTLLPATIAGGTTSGYATYFTDSGNISLGSFPNTFRIAFKYVGGYSPVEATSTYQVDNVHIFDSHNLRSIGIYDIANNTWSSTNTVMPQQVSANAVAANGNNIFVSGDYVNQSFLGYYDTAADTFTSVAALGYLERRHHNAEFYNNSLYVFGGNTGVSSSTAMNSTQSAALGTLGTTEIVSGAGLKAYPNPVKNQLNISFHSTISTVAIYNLIGQQVMSKSINANQGTVDVSGLAAGTYVVKAAAGDEVKTLKVIKQ
jgi:hypothetical protein